MALGYHSLGLCFAFHREDVYIQFPWGGPQSSRRGCNLFAAFITVLADTAGHVTLP